jgi:hypothetical protein
VVNDQWYDPNQSYSCAICGEVIAPMGYDPCRVTIEARPADASTYGSWEYWVHAQCVPRTFEPALRQASERDGVYEFKVSRE